MGFLLTHFSFSRRFALETFDSTELFIYLSKLLKNCKLIDTCVKNRGDSLENMKVRFLPKSFLVKYRDNKILQQ